MASDSFQPQCRLISGNLEWQDKNKSRCLVMWRRPEEWAKFIYQWVSLRSEKTRSKSSFLSILTEQLREDSEFPESLRSRYEILMKIISY